MRNPLETALGNARRLAETQAKEECERFFSGEFPLPSPPPPETLPAWLRRAFAEAALFRSIVDRNDPPRLTDDWREVRPFGDGSPTLGSLLAADGAMACFPTCSGDDSALWHLFVFAAGGGVDPRSDHRRFLCGSTMFDDHTAVFISSGFSPPEHPLNGCSWQLAAAAALNLDRQFRGELAGKWLITGEMNGSRICRVKIGAKQELFENTTRKIMLPRENQTDVVVAENLYPAETLEQALQLIDGRGFENAVIGNLPEISDLHILVGGSRKPVISVILQICPTRICLWCSDKTRTEAGTIAAVIRGLPFGTPPEITICEMDSHNLQQAYDAISRRIKENGGAPDNTLVCNTGGNRLMGTAALLAANACNLTVVYRDLNAVPDLLTVLKLGEKNRYQSGDVKINRCPFREQIDWEFLHSKDSGEKTDGSALLARIWPGRDENITRPTS